VLEIRDAEDRLGAVVQSVELPLTAEAYKIEVDMKFPGEGSELDFGLVRVLEDSLKTMSIANTGKYEVGYRFRIKGAAMRELFTITPQEGAIEPGTRFGAGGQGRAQVRDRVTSGLGLRPTRAYGLNCMHACWFL